jgi:hypothetical protein
MFLLDTRVRYIILSIVIFLSFLHYLNDPLKNSDAIECLGLQCRQYSLIINLLSFTFLAAMMISMGILNKSIYVPGYWYVPIIVIGYFAIYLDWHTNKIVRPEKGKITPPPIGFIPKDRRIVIVSCILVLYFVLFVLNYMSHRVPVQIGGFADKLFWNSFGSYQARRGAFMLSWISILGLVTGSLNIYYTDVFHPGTFDLPNSWRI